MKGYTRTWVHDLKSVMRRWPARWLHRKMQSELTAALNQSDDGMLASIGVTHNRIAAYARNAARMAVGATSIRNPVQTISRADRSPDRNVRAKVCGEEPVKKPADYARRLTIQPNYQHPLRKQSKMETNLSQHANGQPDIRITDWDLGRLQHLISVHASKGAWQTVEFLMSELTRAHIVDERAVPEDVATMRSRVRFRVDDSEIDRLVTLSYPSDRDYYDDGLSVLTPVGAALIGLSEGQTIIFPASDGYRKALKLLKVVSQPERAGRAEGGHPHHSAHR